MVASTDLLKPGISRARQLAESDDIASNLVIDTLLEFTTHKMAARFRPLKVDRAMVKESLQKYRQNGDIECAYEKIVFCAGDWGRYYFLNKSKAQLAAFKEHVSYFHFHL